MPRPPPFLVGWSLAGLAGGFLAGCGREEAEDTAPEVVLVDEDEDGWPLPYDCDDELPAIHPGATEHCDGEDEDCDGVVDDHPADGVWAWLDMDRDGRGDPATGDYWCGNTEDDARPWVSNDSDCDDGNHAVYPSAWENCADGVDSDCDGTDNDVDAVGCAPWYEDRDGDGVGIEREQCLCEAEGNYRASTAGDCDDDDPTRTDGCGLTGARSLAETDVAILGATESERAGTWIAPAGDPDGDGWPDLLIAGPTSATRPRWYLVRGPFDGDKDLAAPSATFREQGLINGQVLPVSGGVDLDGDGGDEMVLAGYGTVATSRWGGFAYVISGPTAGAVDLNLAAARFEGGRTTSSFPITVAASPDTDGDGVGDLLIGGPWASSAFLFTGPLQGALDPRAAALTVTETGIGLGVAVAAAGDVDGDGLGDLLVGADLAEAGLGAALLVAGGVTGSVGVDDAAAVLAGPSNSLRAGLTVAGPGDVDGDGYDDVLVGGPATVGAFTMAGSVWLVHGPVSGEVSLEDADARVEGRATQQGAYLSGRAGDIDGDGLPDLLVGAGADDTAGQDAGGAFLYFSPLAGAVDTLDADLRLYGVAARDGAGTVARGTGDLDQDGYDDLVLGVPGLDLGATDAGGAFIVRGGER